MVTVRFCRPTNRTTCTRIRMHLADRSDDISVDHRKSYEAEGIVNTAEWNIAMRQGTIYIIYVGA